MAVQRRVAQGSAPFQTVSFNDWIRVPIPGNPSSAKMQIDTRAPQSAFIDRVRTSTGWQTVAALRTPNLRPGEYTVKIVGIPSPISVNILVL